MATARTPSIGPWLSTTTRPSRAVSSPAQDSPPAALPHLALLRAEARTEQAARLSQDAAQSGQHHRWQRDRFVYTCPFPTRRLPGSMSSACRCWSKAASARALAFLRDWLPNPLQRLKRQHKGVLRWVDVTAGDLRRDSARRPIRWSRPARPASTARARIGQQ